MSPAPPPSTSTPRRGTQRPSHLREVSNGSSDTTIMSRPVTAASDTGTIQHDPVLQRLAIERRCILWVHDEGFSKEEVVFNIDLFPEVRSGELMAIMALKTDSGLRDFQEKPQTSKRDSDTLATAMQRERSSSNPRSPGTVNGNGSDTKHDVDIWNRYLFVARDMPKDMKVKQPSLEVSVAKHIADAFGLKHRANVLLTTVFWPSKSFTVTFLTNL